MQSILQHRRFERRLREQVKRHGIDATAGVRGSTRPHTKSSSDPAIEPKDLEAGHAPLVEGRDHTSEEKNISNQEPEKLQPDYLGAGDNAVDDENLSGSTTRSSW